MERNMREMLLVKFDKSKCDEVDFYRDILKKYMFLRQKNILL